MQLYKPEFFLVSLLAALVNSKCGYESCNLGKPGMINVHLVPHTHDDVGWLKTVDQYYVDEVQYILDSVVMALQVNPDRKFSYVETAFFYRWWQQQDDPTRHRVKKLVNDGQLSFILGGWCMNDEAATHYNAIIDQHTRGVQFLKQNFGECGRPRVAWQIDPFGHSREQASLFAQMGYDAVYFARIDYQDYEHRNKTRQMEMIWKGSDDLDTDLFTGALYGEHYGPPEGMNFDIYAQNNIQDDKRLHDYNVDKVVDQAIKDAKLQNLSYMGEHIMWTEGMDFNYQNAQTWFKNLDKLIKYTNARQSNGSKVNLFYSTPTCYTYAKNQLNLTWTTKSDDFFPYAHRAHAYWTGYFTSRAALKGMVRETNNFLQAVKQLDALADLGPEHSSDFILDKLKRAMAVAQHHDAVSGTAKQAVTYDYELRLSEGVMESMEIVNHAYQKLAIQSKSFTLPEQKLCPLVNISMCPETESSNMFSVMAYNPIGRPVSTWINVPVTNMCLNVTDSQTKIVETQYVPLSKRTAKIPERNGSKAVYNMWFKADLPALGYSTFFVTPTTEAKAKLTVPQAASLVKDTVISNQLIKLTFDAKTGLLKEYNNLKKTIKINMKQQLLYYIGMKGDNSKPELTASGAYLFRPNGTQAYQMNKIVQISVIHGNLLSEVHQKFSDWGTQVIRLRNHSLHVEIEWTVGPIPQHDKLGREVISRFETEMNSQDVFYTDANGRQMLQRTVNYRPTWKYQVNEPVSGNYYPINSRIFIQDLKKSVQMTVLTDRSQGGGSVTNGSIEIMLHRVTMCDDGLGVGEPLKEAGADGKGLIVRGTHYLLVDDFDTSARLHRDLAEKLYMAPIVTFSQLNNTSMNMWKKYAKLQGSFIKKNLPDNVHLLTLESLQSNTLLLRLENFYSLEENDQLSKKATVSLKDLFSVFTITAVKELTLEANQYLSDLNRLSWNKKSFNPVMKPVGKDLVVSLSPMMIRTFEVTFS